jgi:hypothetical protein
MGQGRGQGVGTPEVLSRAPAITGSIHRELEKVKFPKFLGASDGAATEAWLENMAMCFALRDYTSNMKIRMAVFQLKGSALLWWKTLLPQLNMAVEDVSWELFEERFRERYLSEEFIKRWLNEFNALRQGGRTVPESEARVMALLRHAPHLNPEKLKVSRFVLGLNSSMCARVCYLEASNLAQCRLEGSRSGRVWLHRNGFRSQTGGWRKGYGLCP